MNFPEIDLTAKGNAYMSMPRWLSLVDAYLKFEQQIAAAS
jgi:hypothetical protein